MLRAVPDHGKGMAVAFDTLNDIKATLAMWADFKKGPWGGHRRNAGMRDLMESRHLSMFKRPNLGLNKAFPCGYRVADVVLRGAQFSAQGLAMDAFARSQYV